MRILLGVVLVIIALAIGLPGFFLIVNGGAFLQPNNTICVRRKGMLRLGEPEAPDAMAKEDLPFALLSQAAYEKASSDLGDNTETWSATDLKLCSGGWKRWSAWFNKDRQEFAKYHLRAEVWENSTTNQVVVTFGGTDATFHQDWAANFRWFIPNHVDQYTLVVANFGVDFAEEFKRRSAEPDSFLRGAELIVTGHSLGGGLAQEFAYSLGRPSGVPRVTRVYAFDPSPVTGYFSVKKSIREQNRQGLKIDRIYQRREVLAILRSLINLFHRPSAENPEIQEIRYGFHQNWNPVIRHSIGDLALNLQKLVGREAIFGTVPSTDSAGCIAE